MFSKVRKRLTYVNVLITFALVFAMSGGAFAAKHYLITSTSQISPKVLKALAGKRGPSGATGASGVAGKDGAPGAAGEKGAPGEKGVAGESVTSKEVKPADATCSKRGGSEFTVGATTTFACNGKEGPEGPQGEPWTAGGTLPSGKTETGVFTFGLTPEGKIQLVPISFNIPLPAALDHEHVHYVHAGESPLPPACQGDFMKPTAAPGNLCVYEKNVEGAWVEIFPPSKGPFQTPGADPEGAGLVFQGESTQTIYGYGAWAVTAP